MFKITKTREEALEEAWQAVHEARLKYTRAQLDAAAAKAAEEEAVKHLQEMEDAWRGHVLDFPPPPRMPFDVLDYLRRTSPPENE